MARNRDIRSEILEAATEMFAARGFDGTSLQSIADAVDITKPSLLYHYSSKEKLREEVLEAVFSHWNSVLPQILQAATSGDRRFEALTEEIISFFSQDVDRARLLMRETMDRPNEMREWLDEYLRPWMSILADYIEKGQEEGVIYRDLVPESYIVNVLHFVVGAIATSEVFGSLVGSGAPGGVEAEGDREGPNSAQIEELVRIARTALFVDDVERSDLEYRPDSEAEARADS